jgi:hypothetical protein
LPLCGQVKPQASKQASSILYRYFKLKKTGIARMELPGHCDFSRPNPRLDALAYVDDEYNDPLMQAEVSELIKQEMRRFTKPDYLALHPTLKPYEANFSEHIQAEFSRIKKGEVRRLFVLSKLVFCHAPICVTKGDTTLGSYKV